jgi:hypothetical protein
MATSTSKVRKFWLISLFMVPCLLWATWFHYGYRPEHRLKGPRLVYWAWERPEDLRFLDAKAEGVAFLARSVELLPDSVRVQPRMQPLYLGPGIQVVAVVRIFSRADKPAALTAQQLSETLQALLAATREPAVTALQIDFDARVSERAFYSQLLAELRRNYLGSTGAFPEPLCRGSLGISTGEWWPNPVHSRTRVYVFHQGPWTQEAVEEVRSRIHRGM